MKTRHTIYMVCSYLVALALAFVLSFVVEPGVAVVCSMFGTVILGAIRECYSKWVQKKSFDDYRWLFNLAGAGMANIPISMFIKKKEKNYRLLRSTVFIVFSLYIY